jgi:hypothetical protein
VTTKKIKLKHVEAQGLQQAESWMVWAWDHATTMTAARLPAQHQSALPGGVTHKKTKKNKKQKERKKDQK